MVALAFRPFQARHLHLSEDHACESARARAHAFPDGASAASVGAPGGCPRKAQVAVPLGGGKPGLLHRSDWRTFYLCQECLAALWKDECDGRGGVNPRMSRFTSEFNQQPERFLRPERQLVTPGR